MLLMTAFLYKIIINLVLDIFSICSPNLRRMAGVQEEGAVAEHWGDEPLVQVVDVRPEDVSSGI